MSKTTQEKKAKKAEALVQVEDQAKLDQKAPEN